MSSFSLIIYQLRFTLRKAQQTVFGTGVFAFAAAAFKSGKTALSVFGTSAKLCYCACKINSVNALGDDFTMVRIEDYSAAFEMKFAAGFVFMTKNGGVFCFR